MTPDPFTPRRDWCSCSPDVVFGIYIGADCWQHDADCEQAALETDPERKKDLYKRAHLRLRAAIMRRFRSKAQQAGIVGRAVWLVRGRIMASIYWTGLHLFNPLYRRVKDWRAL